MAPRSRRIPALALLALSLSACGKPSGQGEIGKESDRSAYDAAGCRFGFEEGEGADLGVAGMPDTREMIFGKHFPYHLFRAVSRASGRATVEFMARQGVKAYGILGTEGACGFGRALAPAPGDVADEWERQSRPLPEGERIIGLYLAKGSPKTPSAKDSAITALRRDASRSTYLHEFSHHLFETERVRRGSLPFPQEVDQLEEAVDLYDSAVKLYQASPSAELGRKQIGLFLKSSAAIRKLLASTSLEEMAIETLLLWEDKEGRLSHAPILPRQRNGYIASSALKAQEALKVFMGEKTKAEKIASEHALAEENQRIQEEAQALIRLHEEIQRHARPARDALAETSPERARADAAALALLSPAERDADADGEPPATERCGRSALEDRIDAILQRVALQETAAR
jgi:hypothetical protein